MLRRALWFGIALLGMGCQPPPARRSAEAPQVEVAASEPAPAKGILSSEEVDQLWLRYSALTDAARKSNFVDQHVVALTETYVLRHAQLERLQIVLSPLGADAVAIGAARLAGAGA